MMKRKHQAPRNQFDLAFIQVACMAELAQNIHPSEAFYATPEKARSVLANIVVARAWLEALAEVADLRLAEVE